MSVKNFDTYQLLDRFDSLVGEYVPLAAELASKIEKFGKYRKELQLIVAELSDRGINPETPEDLSRLLETVLEERGLNTKE